MDYLDKKSLNPCSKCLGEAQEIEPESKGMWGARCMECKICGNRSQSIIPVNGMVRKNWNKENPHVPIGYEFPL